MHAIILAGGRSSRMGSSKALLRRDGAPALRTAVEAAAKRIDGSVVVVAGPDVDAALPPGSRCSRVREDPPLGGPVAALSAGLAALPDDESDILVLAVDLVHIDAVVDALLACPVPAGADVVALPGERGPQWLAARYRRGALAAALHRVGTVHGASMRAAMQGVVAVTADVAGDVADDVDTPAEAIAAGFDLGG